MTYVMSMSSRYPHKINISRNTGNIWGTELLPAMASGSPVFLNNEAVPFRFTPNIQLLMGPIAIEGIFSCAIMAIARCLTEPEVCTPKFNITSYQFELHVLTFIFLLLVV